MSHQKPVLSRGGLAGLAEVLTFVRTSLPGDGAPVSEEEDASIRETYGSRDRPWTAQALRAGSAPSSDRDAN